MITRIQALNYRTLRYIDQSVDEFHAMVGPNGSGKSSFLDTVALLSDITRVGVQGAIFGDPGMGVSPRSSDPRMLTWMGQQDSFEIAIEFRIPDGLRIGGKYEHLRYEVGVSVGTAQAPAAIKFEALYMMPKPDEHVGPAPTLFPTMRVPRDTLETTHTPGGWKSVVKKTSGGKDYFRSERSSYNTQFTVGVNKSALAGLPADETRFPVAIWAQRFLREGVQRIQLDAEAMRIASPPGRSSFYLSDGSNLAWVVDDFKRRSGERRFRRWVEHVGVAVPGVTDVATVIREDDRHMYLVLTYENGLRAPSWVLSDGTLRILALTLLAYLEVDGGLILVEEPENGVHPRAIGSVVDALSHIPTRQVMIASHSPVVLQALSDHQVLCFAKDDHGVTDIVRGNLHPDLKNWKQRPDLGNLLVAGVLG